MNSSSLRHRAGRVVRGVGLATAAATAAFAPSAEAWQPVEGTLMSQWAEDVNPEAPLQEYPRPTLRREAWHNLNGLWDYAIAPRMGETPTSFDGEILVPFPIESALSGVQKRVGPDERLWYRRGFEVPAGWSDDDHVLLHLGAVDWESEVWLNGHRLGTHRGGFDPFTFDITHALNDDGPQELVVAVWDPTDAGYQPRGKQVQDPGGIFYTPVTGIWQTVWIEPVPATHFKDLTLVPNIEDSTLTVTPAFSGAADGLELRAIAKADGETVAEATEAANETLTLSIDDARLWSPSQPFLYDLEVVLLRDGEVVDHVNSYFGMRSIAVKKDDEGINRLFLNGEPLFQYGPLDQGWWPDGLYTAPTDEALAYDVEITKRLGFNMIRKHVKIEPPRWYYHCDRLGLLVWQDMPSGDAYIGPNDEDMERVAQSERQFYAELEAMIDLLYNHPSIVMWVPFNEGWGQFETATVTDWVAQRDPTRLVNQASGWTDRGGGDVHDMHKYPGPGMPPVEEDRAAVLGEFGGLGLPVADHLWVQDENWGYQSYEDRDGLRDHYTRLLDELHLLIGQGLAAAVYTQTTDVETEVNGLLTYDREVIKMGEEWLAQQNERLYTPPPRMSVVLPTSENEGHTWRYTTEQPADDWAAPGFDASGWQQGEAVFGTEGTPGANVRTTWDTGAIWLRRTVELSEEALQGDLKLKLLHDEDATVYINGVLAAEADGHTSSYAMLELRQEARDALTPGENVIAVHCRQTDGGQSIDLGLVSVEAPAAE